MFGHKKATIDTVLSSTHDANPSAIPLENSPGTSRRNLLLGGAAGLFLVACSSPDKAPAAQQSSPDGDPTTAPASGSGSTVGNMLGVTEGELYKKLSPEDRAIVDKYRTMSPDEFKLVSSPDRFIYTDFLAASVHDYTVEQIVANYSGDQAKIKKFIDQNVGNGVLAQDMTGGQIAANLAFRRAEAFWLVTKGGDPSVVEDRVPDALKLLFSLSTNAFQTDAHVFEGLAAINPAEIVFPGKSGVALDESPIFKSPRTGQPTILIEHISSDEVTLQQDVCSYTPSSTEKGAWVKQGYYMQGATGYLSETQLKDKASLEQNWDI